MNKEILRLAVPNILSNLTIPLLGMVDLHLMGHLDSSVFMGAVALGGVIFNFIYWGFSFLRMSISGFSAQAFGGRNRQEMSLVLQRGLMIALAGSFMLLMLQVPVAQIAFRLLEGSDSVKEISRQYYYVRIWAAPAAISLMVFSGWFLGMQNAYYPMIISVSVNLINVVCSILFVRFFGMQAKGVALGSVVGQYSGLVLALVFFFKKYRWVWQYFTIKIEYLRKGLTRLINVGRDIFIRTLGIIAVFTFFTSKSAGLGDITLAANSVLLQFLLFFSYFLDGFAYAAEAMVGRWFGAGNKAYMKQTLRLLFGWGSGLGLLFTIVYGVAGQHLLSFFTDQIEVIERGKEFLPWIVILPLVSFGSYIWDGVFVGATASVAMRNSMVIASVFFFFLPFYLLYPTLNNHALWLGMVLFMLARGVFLTLLFPKLMK
ncbi:MATE family efflux transporter [Thermophagus xiamenensis]|uniref:Multidrug resistance protein, MATE family n=1 Tax=Thermophagus xiamenensis TaxID=385682 RepID=A0A1I1Z0Q3_9BACT|nr:MATE family efflux transporter [Thermophagus xiamenensis]SFE24003.1 multidrug resistance protein, MATE family [Thermophagus xiamenensis]